MENTIGKTAAAAGCSKLRFGQATALIRRAADNAFRHLRIFSYGIFITSLSLPSRNPLARWLCWSSRPARSAERIARLARDRDDASSDGTKLALI